MPKAFFYLLTGIAAITIFIPRAYASDCRYSRKQLVTIEENRTPEDFRTKDIYAQDWACLELKKNLKGDSLQNCTPDQSAVSSFYPKAALYLTGTSTFDVSVLSFHKPYRYQVFPAENGKINVQVRIHFTGDAIKDPNFAHLVQTRLDEAAAIWTNQSPDKRLEFKFLSVAENNYPFFNVEIKPRHGDIYYSSWDTDAIEESWGKNTIAHELGHMMGLTDEYDPFRDTVWQVKDELDTRQCNIRGFMCNNYEAKAYPHYYYLILRRAVCANH